MNDSTLAAVQAADDRRKVATVAGDLDTLAALLDDDVIYAHSTGVVDSKASYLDGLSSGRTRYLSLATTIDRHVDMGAAVAVHGTMSARIEVQGQLRDIEVVYLAVWRQSAGGWRLAAFQSARPPA